MIWRWLHFEIPTSYNYSWFTFSQEIVGISQKRLEIDEHVFHFKHALFLDLQYIGLLLCSPQSKWILTIIFTTLFCQRYFDILSNSFCVSTDVWSIFLLPRMTLQKKTVLNNSLHFRDAWTVNRISISINYQTK